MDPSAVSESAGTHEPSPPAPSTRDRILDTAEPLFARCGFAGVGLREVAERVGMGKSSLFHHFPSKLELYVAVMERVFTEFDVCLAARESPAKDPVQRLHVLCEATVRLLVEHRNWAALLLRSIFEEDVIGGEDRERIDALYDRLIGRVSQALQQGIETGQIRAVSAPHSIQTLIGMTVFHFASGEMGDHLFGDSVYAPQHVEDRLAHIRDYIEHGLRSG